jgi:hypothetical protein
VSQYIDPYRPSKRCVAPNPNDVIDGCANYILKGCTVSAYIVNANMCHEMCYIYLIVIVLILCPKNHRSQEKCSSK